MDDLEFLKRRLAKTTITELERDADEMGVPFGTLHKVKYGKTRFPRWDTVRRAVEFYRARDTEAARKSRRTAKARLAA